MTIDVRTSDDLELKPVEGNDQDLVDYIMGLVNPWEDWRNDRFKERWDEYYRMWTGKWDVKDKAKKSEKSRYISPVIQQSMDTVISDQEEAVFGKPRWVVFDEYRDQEKQEVSQVNQKFLWDAHEANIEGSVVECMTNGAAYGTLIGKVVVREKEEWTPDASGLDFMPLKVTEVGLEAISPYEFVIDPAGRTIEEAHGMAHITYKPLNSILDKIDKEIYYEVDVHPYDSTAMDPGTGAPGRQLRSDGDEVKIIEYHGLVPAALMGKSRSSTPRSDDEDMVEAIVTIANDSELLRKVNNPFPMQDRSFVAAPHSKMPGEFWGRGIIEKAYWPSKVMSAETRARTDALAFSSSPMTLTDATKIQSRGQNFEVRAGRNILVNGDPATAVVPVRFPGPDPNTWQQTGEMERMVEMATGAISGSTPTNINPKNSTATGMSMIQGASIKRGKGTLQNIERYFLEPMVRKVLLRQMKYNTEQYPVRNYQFRINATMGIMAREYEVGQLTQLLQTAQPGSPAYWMLLYNIYENSSTQSREQMQALIRQQLEKSLNPPKPQPDLGDVARIESVKQRGTEHEDKMELEYAKLNSDDDNASKERTAGLTKEYIKK